MLDTVDVIDMECRYRDEANRHLVVGVGVDQLIVDQPGEAGRRVAHL